VGPQTGIDLPVLSRDNLIFGASGVCHRKARLSSVIQGQTPVYPKFFHSLASLARTVLASLARSAFAFISTHYANSCQKEKDCFWAKYAGGGGGVGA